MSVGVHVPRMVKYYLLGLHKSQSGTLHRWVNYLCPSCLSAQNSVQDWPACMAQVSTRVQVNNFVDLPKDRKDTGTWTVWRWVWYYREIVNFLLVRTIESVP